MNLILTVTIYGHIIAKVPPRGHFWAPIPCYVATWSRIGQLGKWHRQSALAASAVGCLGIKRQVHRERSIWDNHSLGLVPDLQSTAGDLSQGYPGVRDGKKEVHLLWVHPRQKKVWDSIWIKVILTHRNQFSSLSRANTVSSPALGENHAQKEKMVSNGAFSLSVKSTPCCPRSWPCHTYSTGNGFPPHREAF